MSVGAGGVLPCGTGKSERRPLWPSGVNGGRRPHLRGIRSGSIWTAWRPGKRCQTTRRAQKPASGSLTSVPGTWIMGVPRSSLAFDGGLWIDVHQSGGRPVAPQSGSAATAVTLRWPGRFYGCSSHKSNNPAMAATRNPTHCASGIGPIPLNRLHVRNPMTRRKKESKPTLNVNPINSSLSMRRRVYQTLKKAISEMDIYEFNEEVRLDERKLCEDMQVSRTPIREAMALLEREGFVRSVPRRGIFVVRKTKREVVELITAWAALESMAARLAASRASMDELAELHDIMREYEREMPSEHLSEYSSANIAFHQKIIECAHSSVISDMIADLVIHVRGIRKITIRRDSRAERSIKDHLDIIRALETRDPDLAEKLVREHALGLAAYVEKYGDFLDVDGNGNNDPYKVGDYGT